MSDPNMIDECTTEDIDSERQEERKSLYAETRKDLLLRQLSNSERYDNAILSLSRVKLGQTTFKVQKLGGMNTH